MTLWLSCFYHECIKMGNVWMTLWLFNFYDKCIKWDKPGLHYGYCTVTMNALNGKCKMRKHQKQFQIDMVLQLVHNHC